MDTLNTSSIEVIVTVDQREKEATQIIISCQQWIVLLCVYVCVVRRAIAHRDSGRHTEHNALIPYTIDDEEELNSVGLTRAVFY